MEKTCTKCVRVKPLDEFSKRKALKNGYRSQCKACDKEHNTKFYRDNQDTRKAYSAEWRTNNPERKAEYNTYWRSIPENAIRHQVATDNWRKANEGRRKSVAETWRLANPDRIRQYKVTGGALRRAREANTVPFTADQLAQRWAYYGGMCWMGCGAIATATDHVKPLAKGGAHMLANLRPICQPCNSSKGAKWPLKAAA